MGDTMHLILQKKWPLFKSSRDYRVRSKNSSYGFRHICPFLLMFTFVAHRYCRFLIALTKKLLARIQPCAHRESPLLLRASAELDLNETQGYSNHSALC